MGPTVKRSQDASPEWMWLRPTWWLCYPGTALLAARLVYEQTYLTWKYGPQMVGFSLAHGGAFSFAGLAVSALLLHLWVLASVFGFLWRRGGISRGHAWRVTLALATIGVIYVPYGAWKAVLTEVGATGGRQSAFLVDAAARGDLRLVRKLIENGSPVDAQDSDGDTALKGAAVAGRLEVVRYLIEKGADPNKRAGILESTPLICAAEMGHAEIVDLLLARGADPTPKDKKGQSALILAERNGHKQIGELLRKAQPRQ